MGGVLCGLPGPHPATWCLALHPGLRAPVVDGRGFGAGGGEALPERQRKQEMGQCTAETLNPSACSLDFPYKMESY